MSLLFTPFTFDAPSGPLTLPCPQRLRGRCAALGDSTDDST
jgi:hypothetical protein